MKTQNETQNDEQMIQTSKFKNHRMIKVKFMPCTNYNGAYIKLIENRFNGKDIKKLRFEDHDGLITAREYLRSIGINPTGFGSFDSEVFIFSNSWADDNGFINIKGEIE